MLRALAAGLDRAAAIVACVLVVALLVCVALGVVSRALGEPFIWTDELSRFLMVWLAVFGWVLATRKRIHIRIRFFQDRLPSHLHRFVEVALQAAMTLFGALIAIYGTGLIGKNYDLEATSLPISMAWMYAPMALGGAITALQGAIELAEALRSRRGSPPGDAAATE